VSGSDLPRPAASEPDLRNSVSSGPDPTAPPSSGPDFVARGIGRLPPPKRPAQPFAWEKKLLAWHSFAVYLFLYVPIAILILYSFNRSKRTAAWEGLTLDWYARLFENDLILRAVKNSLIVAVLATIASTVIGTLAALALARHDFRGRGMTQAALYLPIIIPEIVIGAAMVTFFGVLELRLSLATVVVAHVAFCISYVAIVVRARLSGFDRSLEEAASDLGAGPWDTFRRVTLPIILPGIVAGALLVFTLSIDDYVVSSFVAGVGATTLPIQIYSMLKVGVTPEVNAVSTLLLLLTVVLIAVAQRLQQEPVPLQKGARKK
jgi:spermidine/putrescine transport system permease protein